jgi:hypothetical protein
MRSFGKWACVGITLASCVVATSQFSHPTTRSNAAYLRAVSSDAKVRSAAYERMLAKLDEFGKPIVGQTKAASPKSGPRLEELRAELVALAASQDRDPRAALEKTSQKWSGYIKSLVAVARLNPSAKSAELMGKLTGDQPGDGNGQIQPADLIGAYSMPPIPRIPQQKSPAGTVETEIRQPFGLTGGAGPRSVSSTSSPNGDISAYSTFSLAGSGVSTAFAGDQVTVDPATSHVRVVIQFTGVSAYCILEALGYSSAEAILNLRVTAAGSTAAIARQSLIHLWGIAGEQVRHFDQSELSMSLEFDRTPGSPVTQYDIAGEAECWAGAGGISLAASSLHAHIQSIHVSATR